MIMHGEPQPIYPQHNKIVMAYKGQQAFAQHNGIPYNNPSIQYSNLPNNTQSGFDENKNPISQQNYNMIPKSSSERGYNPNFFNEKGMK